MTNPEPCDSAVTDELGSPKNAKIVTTPGERSAKIRSGSKPLPGKGATFDVAEAGKAAGRGAPARTTTVFVPWSSQPDPFPMPKAAPPPKAAAATVTTARAGSRIRLTVATVLPRVRFPVKTGAPPKEQAGRGQISFCRRPLRALPTRPSAPPTLVRSR